MCQVMIAKMTIVLTGLTSPTSISMPSSCSFHIVHFFRVTCIKDSVGAVISLISLVVLMVLLCWFSQFPDFLGKFKRLDLLNILLFLLSFIYLQNNLRQIKMFKMQPDDWLIDHWPLYKRGR